MRRRALLLLALVTPVLLAVAGQLAIPPVAEARLQKRLDEVGEVHRVDVAATPAVKLLGGRVDRLAIAMASVDLKAVRSGAVGSTTSDVLDRLRHVDQLRATVDELRAEPLHAERVQVAKDDRVVRLAGTMSLEGLRRALPGVTVRVEHGMPVLEVASPQLPLPGPLQIELTVADGAVVARGRGAAALLLGTKPLLDEPGLEVTSLVATERSGRIELAAEALLA